MKTTRLLITAVMLICCISTFAQTAKKPSASSVKIIAEKVQALDTNTEKQFLVLQEENKVLKDQLQKMESEIALYRDDVRDKVAEMNSNMSDWAAMLSIVIGFIAAALGVVAPIFFNREQNKHYREKLEELKKQLEATERDAESARNSLNDITKLKDEITSIKNKIEESENSAKLAAENARINRLFTEALAEHDRNPQKAIDLYTKILEIDSNYVKAYNNRGGIRKKIGDINGAMADYNKAIDLNPTGFSAYNNRANLKFITGDTQGALDDFSKAGELNPNNAYLLNNIADMSLKLNKLDKALNDIEKAINLDSSIPCLYITKGEIYMAINKYLEASLEFTNALSLDNNIKEAYKLRAECYRELAKNIKDEEKEKEYITLAKADEKRFEDL